MTAAPPRQEFERKFLVLPKLLPNPLPPGERFVQGYLGLEPLQIRIRVIDGRRAFLQFKGADCFESDSLPLPLDQAEYLFQHYLVPGTTLIEKDWHRFPDGPDGRYFELHVFQGTNEGLFVAEIEMPSLDYILSPERLPAWLGPEVTDDPRFKNKKLTLRPFGSWPEKERQEIRQKMGLV